MAYDRFLIAPLDSGLQTDLKPWLISDSAWEQLQNAYLFRGRVRKRFGAIISGTSVQGSRLRVALSGGAAVGTTNGAGNATGTVPGSIFGIGQQFSIGTTIYTVYQTGTPAAMFKTDATTTATYNTTTGAYNFVGAPINTQIYFYPATPVMGLTQYEIGAVNQHPSIAFDRQFAYSFSGGSWNRITSTPNPIWHGSDSQFFWSTNWQGLTPDAVDLFTTNFNVPAGTGALTDDPIWVYDGTNWNPFTYSPVAAINTGNTQPYTVTRATAVTGAIILSYVQSALIIVAFKNRLVLLNTIENNANGATAYNTGTPTTTGITPTNYQTSTNTAYPWRARYSQYGSPFARNAWLEQNQVFTPNIGATLLTAQGGGYVDAATEEGIVSAEFIKDRLMVYFERSTWELVYSGNEIQPFNWQKINTELGSESTYSIVSFDKVVLGIGETGVHACNGSNVERIDSKIPDQVFQIRNANEGDRRVHGIRDYDVEQTYWTFPSITNTIASKNDVFPNQVLVYNYKTGTWAFNDDSMTAFGYFEQQTGMTWASSTTTWGQSNFSWQSGTLQANHRQIIAGNQQGFIFIISPDSGRNAPALQITNMTNDYEPTVTIINHNIPENSYVYIENVQGLTGVNDIIYFVTQVVDINTIKIGFNLFGAGTYTGGGTITRVSQIQMKSKQWNPYVDKDKNFYLAKINFAVQKTTNGEVTVNYFTSSTNLEMVQEGQDSGALLGTNILETFPYDDFPLEKQQTRLWHPVYFQGDGECVQIYITLSPEQMAQKAIVFEDFQLEAILLMCTPTSSRLQ